MIIYNFSYNDHLQLFLQLAEFLEEKLVCKLIFTKRTTRLVHESEALEALRVNPSDQNHTTLNQTIEALKLHRKRKIEGQLIHGRVT